MSSSALETLAGNLTLADLASRTNRTVEDIVAYAFSGGSATRRGGRPAKGQSNGAPSARRGKGVDTRTAAGREAYESAVFGIIEGAKDWVGAADVRAKVGGTPQQFRAATNRLIENGKVKFRGQARGTRYMVA